MGRRVPSSLHAPKPSASRSNDARTLSALDDRIRPSALAASAGTLAVGPPPCVPADNTASSFAFPCSGRARSDPAARAYTLAVTRARCARGFRAQRLHAVSSRVPCWHSRRWTLHQSRIPVTWAPIWAHVGLGRSFRIRSSRPTRRLHACSTRARFPQLPTMRCLARPLGWRPRG